jgi:hypothetical protein
MIDTRIRKFREVDGRGWLACAAYVIDWRLSLSSLQDEMERDPAVRAHRPPIREDRWKRAESATPA